MDAVSSGVFKTLTPCKHEYRMQKFDIASDYKGTGIDVEWCSRCGVLFRWHTQITNERLVELNDQRMG